LAEHVDTLFDLFVVPVNLGVERINLAIDGIDLAIQRLDVIAKLAAGEVYGSQARAYGLLIGSEQT
jgi:hypothetical protein